MEHATIKELANGYYKIKPDAGYQLVNKKSGRTYSEAVTKEINEFEAICYPRKWVARKEN